MKKIRIFRSISFLLSLGLHLLVLSFFFFQIPKPVPGPVPTAIMVDLSSGVGRGAGISSRGKTKLTRSKVRDFSLLAPKQNIGSSDSPNAFLSEESGPFPGSQSFFGKQAAPEKTGAFVWIFQRVQRNLGYPAEFIQNGITGTAQARFRFDRQGRVVGLGVTSDSPYLKVYSYRLLEQLFQKPIPENLRKWEKELEVLCSFRFAFAESQVALSLAMPDSIVGNQLHFSRTKIKSAAEWKMGPLAGLFPVPAVGVDVLWFVRKTEEIVDPKIEVDELAAYRRDPIFYN